MAGTTARRPLPALLAVIALLLLTGLVWWRVLTHDDSDSDAASACPTPSTVASQSRPAASSTLPPPAGVSVIVLNGTQRDGLAGRTLRTLIARGFTSSRPAADYTRKPRITGTALLQYGPAGRPAAALLRFYFPGAVTQPTSATGSTVTVVLGAKYRQVPTVAAVRQALISARVALAPAPSTSGAAPSSSAC